MKGFRLFLLSLVACFIAAAVGELDTRAALEVTDTADLKGELAVLVGEVRPYKT